LATERSEPGAFTFLKLAQDATFQIYYRDNPIILIFRAIVGRRQYRHFRFTYLLSMKAFHLVVSCDEQPAASMAKFDDLWVEHILQWLTILVLEPLWEPLNGKPRRPEPGRYRFSGETFVEK
jgi:hypothetical protein